MAETGILNEDDNVELLEGWIVEKMTKNPRHETTIMRANLALTDRLSREWFVRIRSAITLLDSEPEPDLAIVPGPPARFDDHHPHAQDIALLVEVAESSLAQDRGVKLRIYARARVATYWIVNLIENTIEVHWNPTGPVDAPTYRERRVFRSGEAVPLTIGGRQVSPIPARDILGK